MTTASRLKVLDLFSGIGGFAVAADLVGGFETVAFCEIDPYCQKLLTLRYPGIPVFEDVTTLTAKALRDAGIGKIDVICGGFPCQGFSSAGKKKGLEDNRSSLFFEVIRLIQELRPKVIVLENVRNLLSGSDTEQRADIRCVCGWNPGRGRVHINYKKTGKTESLLLTSSISSNELQSCSSSQINAKDLWRKFLQKERACKNKPGRDLLLANERTWSSSIPEKDFSLSKVKKSTCTSSNQIDVNFTKTQVIPQDGRLGIGCEYDIQEHEDPQPSRNSKGIRLPCPNCGERLVQATVRFVQRNWAGTVFRSLSECGYDAKWSIVSCTEMGGCHQRERVWIVAYPKSPGRDSPRCLFA